MRLSAAHARGSLSVGARHGRARPTAGLVGWLYAVAVAINYPWERVQSRLYVGSDGAGIPWWLCLAASAVDGLLVLLIYTTGLVVMRQREWFARPGLRGGLVMVMTGLAISLGLEWVTVYWLRWWAYRDQMPLVPWLGIGVVPMAQMLILPAVAFRIVTLARSRWPGGLVRRF